MIERKRTQSAILSVDQYKKRTKQYAFYIGGRGGIRTHGTVAGTTVFKTVSFDHSDTLPQQG